jgi:hypothetical protein
LQSYEFVRRFLANTPPEQVHPPRLLTGDDLKQMGYVPGPLFSEILHSLEDAQLEGQVQDKEAALEFVCRRFPHPGRRIKESRGASS